MIALLRTELSRLRHRRVVVGLLLVAVLAPLAMVATTLWSERPVSDAERVAGAEAARAETEQMVEACVADPGNWIDATELSESEVRAECESSFEVEGSSYYVREELNLAGHVGSGGSLTATIMLVATLMFFAGASFAGADWASGSISNQLLMEPRRMRVWALKAGAVALVSTVAAALTLTVFWSFMIGFSRLWDRPEVPGVVGVVVESNLRGLVLVAGSAVVGFAIAMLFRSTASALLALIGLTLGVELLLQMLPIDEPSRWSPVLNLQAWVEHGARYWPQNCWAGCEDGAWLPFAAAAGYLAVLGIVVVTWSVRSFARRDVP